MSWADETLRPGQARLLCWFLDSGSRCVEADGLRFEWVNEWLIISYRQTVLVRVIRRLSKSKGFREDLERLARTIELRPRQDALPPGELRVDLGAGVDRVEASQ